MTLWNNRPLSFISLSHSDNQSESTAKFYNSSKVDVGGNMLTLTSCLLRSDRVESFWMPTDLAKFPVHSICLLRKKLRHLAGSCYYFFKILGWTRWGGGYPHLRSKCMLSAYTCGACACTCMHASVSVGARVLYFSVCQFHFAFCN